MPGHEPLTDLDKELRRLLAIEPSPDFHARLRRRVAGEKMPTGRPVARWTGAALFMSSAAVLTMIALVLLPEAPPPVAPLAKVLARTAPSAPAPGAAIAPPARVRRAAGSAGKRIREPAQFLVEPEVLIDPRVRLAIAKNFEMLQGRRAAEEPEPTAETQPLRTIEVERLLVPALRVSPVTLEKGSEGSRP